MEHVQRNRRLTGTCGSADEGEDEGPVEIRCRLCFYA